MLRRLPWVLLVVLLGCRPADPSFPKAMWVHGPPPVLEAQDCFTLRVLEAGPGGEAKDSGQLSALLDAARQAQDIVVFVHGWRRDAQDLPTMQAFLRIYRNAFDCLRQRDVEGTLSCTALHGFCHPGNPESKLVVLLLWDARSGPFGFRAVQERALAMGRNGVLRLFDRLRAAQGGQGTLIALGHSLGGAMLAASLDEGARSGHVPLDGALVVVAPFDRDGFGNLRPAPKTDGALSPLVLNLFNPRDGYLRIYRWTFGMDTAGERGLLGVPTYAGSLGAAEGVSCQTDHPPILGASLWDAAAPRVGPGGATVRLLNLDLTDVMKGHADIEDDHAIRLYNRAVTELVFQLMWERAFPPSRPGAGSKENGSQAAALSANGGAP